MTSFLLSKNYHIVNISFTIIKTGLELHLYICVVQNGQYR